MAGYSVGVLEREKTSLLAEKNRIIDISNNELTKEQSCAIEEIDKRVLDIDKVIESVKRSFIF